LNYSVIVYSLFILLIVPRLFNLKKQHLLYESVLLSAVFIYGVRDHFNLPPFFFNLGFELLNLFFLIGVIRKKGFSYIRFPAISIFLAFLLINVLSLILNDNDWFDAFMALRYFISTYIFYLAMCNNNYSEAQLKSLNNLVAFLFAYQVIASVLKVTIIGFMEGIVGTINLAGATPATVVPLMGICFALMYYVVYKKNWVYLAFSAGMLFIGLASMKRGVFMYLLILLPVMYYYLNLFAGRSQFLKRISNRSKLMVAGILLLLFVIGVKYNPLANPDGVRGGEFNADYLLKSTLEYSYYNENEYSFGRGSNFQVVLNHSLNDDLVHCILGYGPAKLQGHTRGDGTWEQFGVQGPTTGATNQLVQCGILGAILTVMLFYKYVSGVKKIVLKTVDPYWQAFGISVLLIFCVFLFDYFSYSDAFMSTYAISFTFVFCVAVIRKYSAIQAYKNARAKQAIS
jgi:hypothetical protein